MVSNHVAPVCKPSQINLALVASRTAFIRTQFTRRAADSALAAPVIPQIRGFPVASCSHHQENRPLIRLTAYPNPLNTVLATSSPALIRGRINVPTSRPTFLNDSHTSVAFCIEFLEYCKALSVSPLELATSFIDPFSLSTSEERTANAFFASLSTIPNFSSNEDFCSSLSCDNIPCKSPNISTTERIFPVSSKTLIPAFSILPRTSARPSTEKAFSMRTAARSALCPFPVI